MNWTTPKDLLVGALTLLIVVACLVGGGYWAGHSVATAKAQTKALATERAAARKYQAEVDRGNKAEENRAIALAAMATQYELLQGAFNDVRKRSQLLVAKHAAACPAVGAVVARSAGRVPDQRAGRDGGPAGAAGPGADPAAPADVAPGDPGQRFSDTPDRLTAAAVWLWNSALVGADHPAGACGAADTSEAACSAPADITLGAAWDNQAVNARLCAEDRLNHQRLIDFLKGRQP